MRITMESTATITAINGVEVRLWHGVTEAGVPVLVYVHRLCVPDVGDNCAQFDQELLDRGKREGPAPGLVEAIDLRKVL